MKKGEFDIIASIARKTGKVSPRTVCGIGDDAAVIRPSSPEVLATTDTLMESVHFTWEAFSPFEVGYKALAVNISDIAAMGGMPEFALVSLGIPPGCDEKMVSGFYDGFLSLACEHKIDLVGGNITASPGGFFASVTLLGKPLGKRLFYRNQALEDDLICVSGPLGYAALGYRLLKSDPRNQSLFAQKQKKPAPRMDLARFLAAHDDQGVHALIDLSDGLSGDLGHILSASRKGALVEESKLPCADEFRQKCRELSLDPFDLILQGGEDYELLLTLDASKAEWILQKARQEGLSLIPIGRITEPTAGFRHMRGDGVIQEMKQSSFEHLK